MAKKHGNVSVYKAGQDWVVKSDGATRAAGLYATQEEAKRRGRQLAKNHGGELTVHGMDGKIREKHSYGNDPFPPRG